jgi:DNA-binding transcriptional LysR family regulator
VRAAAAGSLSAVATLTQAGHGCCHVLVPTALEAEVGVRIFDRLPRGVALTEEGRTLLLDERLLVAVSRGHRLARRRRVRLAELADDPFIVGSATAEETLLRASLPSGFQPRVDIVAAEWTGKLGCVAAGLGVALVPALAVRGTPADITLLRLYNEHESVRRLFGLL